MICVMACISYMTSVLRSTTCAEHQYTMASNPMNPFCLKFLIIDFNVHGITMFVGKTEPRITNPTNSILFQTTKFYFTVFSNFEDY